MNPIVGKYCDRPPGSPVPGLEHLFFTATDSDSSGDKVAKQTLSLDHSNQAHSTNARVPIRGKVVTNLSEKGQDGQMKAKEDIKSALNQQKNERQQAKGQDAVRSQRIEDKGAIRQKSDHNFKKNEAGEKSATKTCPAETTITTQSNLSAHGCTKTAPSDNPAEKVSSKTMPQVGSFDDYRMELAKQIEEKKRRRMAEEAAERERDERERQRLLRDQEELQRAYVADLAARAAKEAAKQGNKDGTQQPRRGALPRTPPPAAIARSASAPYLASDETGGAPELAGAAAQSLVQHGTSSVAQLSIPAQSANLEGLERREAACERETRSGIQRRGQGQQSARAADDEDEAISSLGYHIGPLPHKPESADPPGPHRAARAAAAGRVGAGTVSASATQRTKMPLSKALAAAAAAAEVADKGKPAMAKAAGRGDVVGASVTYPSAPARRSGAAARDPRGAAAQGGSAAPAAGGGAGGAGADGELAQRRGGARPNLGPEGRRALPGGLRPARGVRRDVEAARRGAAGDGDGGGDAGGDVRGSLDSTSRFLPAGLAVGDLFAGAGTSGGGDVQAAGDGDGAGEMDEEGGLLGGLRFPLSDSERARLDVMLQSMVLA